MSVGVKTRFEVFKRDRFTCSYCGRTPPEVLLECDHIVPRAAGGSDDMSNLTTACATCNSGKAARLLEDGTGPSIPHATVEAIAERIDQAKAYMELLGGLQAVVDRQIAMVHAAWARAYGAVVIEPDDGEPPFYSGVYDWPPAPSLRRVLRTLTLEEVLDAVTITSAKFPHSASHESVRYFFGICHRSIREGRSPGSPPSVSSDSSELHDLRVENVRLRDELAEERELVEDLRVSVRRLREEAGRE